MVDNVLLANPLSLILNKPREEFNRDRLGILQEQLAVRRADPAVAEALATIEARLSASTG